MFLSRESTKPNRSLLNKKIKTLLLVIALILLTSCARPSADLSETALGPSPSITGSPTITPSPPPVPTSTVAVPTPGAAEFNVSVDQDYSAGIVVITQYYTYLGNGIPEKAYQLLSAAGQKPRSLEDYIETSRLFFKDVEIISIVPYPVDVAEQGGRIPTDPEDRKRFTVYIRAWGEGPMSGSRMSGDLQMLFLALVEEGGTWKIDTFGTSPLNKYPDLHPGLIYVIDNDIYENSDVGWELGIWEAIDVMQQALEEYHPEWALYSYKDSSSEERNVAYYLWNHSNAQFVIVNPRVLMVTAGITLDWQIPVDKDLGFAITEIGVALTQHYRDFRFDESLQELYPMVESPASYALYAYFNYDLEKLRLWMDEYDLMFGALQPRIDPPSQP